MDPTRRKLSSFLTEAARSGVEALDPESACAKGLRKTPVDHASMKEQSLSKHAREVLGFWMETYNRLDTAEGAL